MSQYCVDANIFITAWRVGYPIEVFLSLWGQLAESKDEIILIKPIFVEIDPISPADNKLTVDKKREKYPLRMWLQENDFVETPVNDDISPVSLELEKEYEINDVSKGAGQKDITLIAYAKIMNKTVVTLEAIQTQKPGKKCNYKIPLICDEQNVRCIDFVSMLKELNIRV
jgi:hypothetical protein